MAAAPQAKLALAACVTRLIILSNDGKTASPKGAFAVAPPARTAGGDRGRLPR